MYRAFAAEMARRNQKDKKRQKKQKPKNPAKRETETDVSFIFPGLHQAVSAAVEDEILVPTFHDSDDHENVQKYWSTNIMGKVHCTNADCGTSTWGSKRIAILIRSYRGHEYNALVFNQYCRSCEESGLMETDESVYVDCMAYRLKKWAGMIMEPPTFASQKGLPHEEDLCEGCRRDYCQKAPGRG